jgi:hypothetical protein
MTNFGRDNVRRFLLDWKVSWSSMKHHAALAVEIARVKGPCGEDGEMGDLPVFPCAKSEKSRPDPNLRDLPFEQEACVKCEELTPDAPDVSKGLKSKS